MESNNFIDRVSAVNPVKTNEEPLEVKVYPNPTNGTFVFDLSMEGLSENQISIGIDVVDVSVQVQISPGLPH